MTIQEMHYDFKKKLNKIDSQQYRNLLIPEIDWTLNEASELFVKMIAKPRAKNHLGFEVNQRNIDDIRTLVIENELINITNNVAALPDGYWHYVSAYVNMTKGKCIDIKGRVYVRQHDDEFEESPFDSSTFEWREVNATFFNEGIRFYTDDTFTLTQLSLSYIRRMAYMHNAENFRNGSYNLPSGVSLSGSVDCELPEHTHREIVDIAVLIATGEIQAPDYQIKQAKLNFNKLN